MGQSLERPSVFHPGSAGSHAPRMTSVKAFLPRGLNTLEFGVFGLEKPNLIIWSRSMGP